MHTIIASKKSKKILCSPKQFYLRSDSKFLLDFNWYQNNNWPYYFHKQTISDLVGGQVGAGLALGAHSTLWEVIKLKK